MDECECRNLHYNLNTIYFYHRYLTDKIGDTLVKFNGLRLYKTRNCSFILLIDNVEVMCDCKFNDEVQDECKQKILNCIEKESKRIHEIEKREAEINEKQRKEIIKTWCKWWKS